MDEIDNIILHSLRQIGCALDEEITCMDDINSSLLVQVVSRCISLIDPTLDLPRSLPPGMAQRFTATASLAEACRGIGYRRDIGYQTFLYSNVTEVRRLLMFLIERLPKESSDKSGGSQPQDRTTQLENRICSNLQHQLVAAWIPEFCRTDPAQTNVEREAPAGIVFRRFVPRKLNVPLFVSHSDVVAEIKDFWSQQHNCALNEDTLVPSIISLNDGTVQSNHTSDAIDEVDRQSVAANSAKLSEYYSSKGGATRPVPAVRYSVKATPKHTDEPASKDSLGLEKSPLQTLQDEIERIRTDIEHGVEQAQGLKSRQQEVLEAKESYLKAMAQLKEEKKIKERTHILLEDPEVNVKKLEGIIASSGARMKKLHEQWDAHREPLVAKLDSYRLANSDKLSKAQHIQEQIESARQKSEEVIVDLQTKTALHARLQKEFEKLNKTVSRTAYTSRILEIIANIRKQKNDIDKILQDTRTLQKQINTINGQLDRQFTVTDDLIFRNAKKDEHSKRAYKMLVSLHSDCSELIRLVQETGSIKREVRELEDQIETEKCRNTAANLAQISHDLLEMQNESQLLEDNIRQLESARLRQ